MGANTNYRYRDPAGIANGATKYIGITINPEDGSICAQVSWLDAISSATLTLEFTNYDSDDAPVDGAGDAWKWKDSGLVITGPAASAAGSTLLNVENVRQKRARLKVVAAAATKLEVTE